MSEATSSSNSSSDDATSRLAETRANKRAAAVHVNSPANQRPISYPVGPQRVYFIMIPHLLCLNCCVKINYKKRCLLPIALPDGYYSQSKPLFQIILLWEDS
jgi:hypothetical protein